MVEIYSQYIHDDVLHYVVLPNGDEAEGRGDSGAEKILKTLDYAEVMEAGHDEAIDLYRSVARRLTDYRMWLRVRPEGISNIKIKTSNGTIEHKNIFMLYESGDLVSLADAQE
ncbi:hypothetical protein [Rhizobium sp. LjRoot258]|uniref:hypothetical protein n=1 Tax=Rhizobium sp. LjRoot258 TaxID=3342299 RepID=UPI003ECDD8CE